MHHPTSTQSIHLPQAPSAILLNQNNEIFLSYYTLQPDGTRTGGLAKYNAESGTLLAIKQTNAVLDAKWTNTGQNEIVTVTSKGEVECWRADNLCKKHEMVCNEMDSGDPAFLLFIEMMASSFAVTTDKGNLIVVDATTYQKIYTQQAHSLEAWTVANDLRNPNILFTGGDDALLKGWDLRSPEQSLFTSKRHSAGVTIIRPNPHNPNELVTGSYDDTIAFWDIRNSTAPRQQEVLPIGGGVWRVSFHPQLSDLLAVAGMYSGAHILQSDSNNNHKIVSHFTEHESMVYGIEWIAGGTELWSCSFYDQICYKWAGLEDPASQQQSRSAFIKGEITDDHSFSLF